MVKTVSYDEQEILRDILRLHAKGNNIELDPTYSTGGFYKHGLTKPMYKFDILPQAPGVLQANVESLPLQDELINVIMFDPPFLATKGQSLKSKKDNNTLNKRFGVYPDERALHVFYDKALKELYRVSKKDGILIFKCQDKVSSGKQYYTHCYIYNRAVSHGWYPKDFFILLAKNRLVADWQLKNQQHARKFHCYYWIFQKSSKKAEFWE